MKNEEIKAFSVKEIEDKLEVEKENLQKLEFAHAISPIENPMKIRETRRLIARLNTFLTQKLAESK